MIFTQRSFARRLLQYRDRPMSVWLLLRANAGLHLFQTLMVVIMGLLLRVALGAYGPAIAAAFFAGSLFRDIAYFRAISSVWASVNELIDWPAVERKVD